MDRTETPRHDKVWPCSCGDNHYLRVTFYDVDPEGWISVMDGTHCTSLWCRVKACWKLLRTGAAPHYGCEVVLEPHNVREILETLTQAAEKIGTPE